MLTEQENVTLNMTCTCEINNHCKKALSNDESNNHINHDTFGDIYASCALQLPSQSVNLCDTINIDVTTSSQFPVVILGIL